MSRRKPFRPLDDLGKLAREHGACMAVILFVAPNGQYAAGSWGDTDKRSDMADDLFEAMHEVILHSGAKP